MDTMRFENRSVLVTGAGSGIGRVLVRLFRAEGARVAANDVDREAAQATAAEMGDGVVALQGDVSDEAQVERMLTAAAQAHGPIEVLVNNAAICRADGVASMPSADWDRELAVDLRGPFLCSRGVLPGMIERGGGVILNIASVNGLAYFGNEAYSAAKAGLLSLTRSLAVRYGRDGIRVNAITPGTIESPAWADRVARDPSILESLRRWYPLGRVGQPEDVAKAALFLASEDASWISGAILNVDGGLMAGNPVMAREAVLTEW